MHTPEMTITEALALITGKGSVTDPALECLGEGDLLAVQTLIADHARLTARLAEIKEIAERIAAYHPDRETAWDAEQIAQLSA